VGRKDRDRGNGTALFCVIYFSLFLPGAAQASSEVSVTSVWHTSILPDTPILPAQADSQVHPVDSLWHKDVRIPHKCQTLEGTVDVLSAEEGF
jgi:hypothetical protein